MKKIFLLLSLFLFSAHGAFAAKVTDRLLAQAVQTRSGFLAKQADNQKVRVMFYPVGQKSSNINFSWFDARNIKYRVSKNFAAAQIDASLIPELANIPGVLAADISFPPKLYSSIGAGVYKINAAQYDGGAGVKIAIIDVREPGGGFRNYKQLQAKGELPLNVKTADFVDCLNPANPPPIDVNIEMGVHGSGCAEIIYDIAPLAQMYLLEIDDAVSFQHAVDYCLAEQIDVVSISLGWTKELLYYLGENSEGDKVGYGSSSLAVYIDDASEKMLCVIAAGNEHTRTTPEGITTLSTPADARKALTVGAVNYGYYESGPIEYFSSRGPVKEYDYYDSSGTLVHVSSAIKPEIVAPDGAPSVAYGNSFSGTSASAPHAAGAAALLLSFFQNLNTPELLKNEIIAKYAKPISGQTLPNNTYGYGRLILDNNLVQMIDRGSIIVYPNPASISKKGYVKITNIPLNVRDYEIKIFTITGQFVRSLDFAQASQDVVNGEERKTLTWDLKNQNGDKVALGIYFAAIDTVKGKVIKKIALQK